MNYYYDIYLNFLDNNYMYYEWMDSDPVIHYKKLPLFYVNSKTINDFVNYNVKVDKEFLSLLKNYDNIAIFVDKNSAIALKFSMDGVSIKRSFLNPDDELDIVDITYTLSSKYVNYEILDKKIVLTTLRIEDDIKDVITKEINSIIKMKDYIKLKYIYMEWFNKEPIDNDELVNTLLNRLDNLSIDDINIYNLIKLSIK